VRVSLILTTLDEAQTMRPLLDSLAAQTRPPDEIVVADGGSTDGTTGILAEYAGRLPLRLVAAPGSNISQGRNAAIRASSGDIVAVTDAGVRAEPGWLEELLQPFANGGGPHAVAGFFAPEADTAFEFAMGATVLPQAEDVNPQTYLPSSRSVVFRREVWQAVGGYPEWLDYCEDVVFDLAVRRRFGPFLFRPQAVVRFRPRGSLRQFARQYYQYARGDGKAGLFPRIHAVRYFTYLVLVPLIAYAGFAVSPWLWLLYLAGGLAYLRRPYQRLWPRLRSLGPAARLAALLYVPAIRLAGDLAKMAGYPAGVAWRLANPRP
jgi:glycosyltransferase involved in cell wall biosynthesis